MQCTLDNCSSWLSSTLRVKLTLLHFARAHWLIRMSGRQHVYTYQHLKRASRCWQHDLVRTVNLLFIKGCIVYTLNNRRVTSVQESAVTPVVQITQISEHRSIIYCCARRGALNSFAMCTWKWQSSRLLQEPKYFIAVWLPNVGIHSTWHRCIWDLRQRIQKWWCPGLRNRRLLAAPTDGTSTISCDVHDKDTWHLRMVRVRVLQCHVIH